MFESPSFRFSIKLYVGQKEDFDIAVLFVQSLFCTSLTFTVLCIHLQLNCADVLVQYGPGICGLQPVGSLKFS